VAGAAERADQPQHRHAALREALAGLPPSSQRLVALLAQDPPPPYAQISARLGIPAGSIGPSRGPLLGQAAPPPGHHRPHQRRTRNS
jgi:hypothetical protein